MKKLTTRTQESMFDLCTSCVSEKAIDAIELMDTELDVVVGSGFGGFGGFGGGFGGFGGGWCIPIIPVIPVMIIPFCGCGFGGFGGFGGGWGW